MKTNLSPRLSLTASDITSESPAGEDDTIWHGAAYVAGRWLKKVEGRDLVGIAGAVTPAAAQRQRGEPADH